jgi:hypothetical protein
MPLQGDPIGRGHYPSGPGPNQASVSNRHGGKPVHALQVWSIHTETKTLPLRLRAMADPTGFEQTLPESVWMCCVFALLPFRLVST